MGLIAFVLAESWYGDDALIPLRLFRNRLFSLVQSVGVIVGMRMFGGIAAAAAVPAGRPRRSPIESGFQMLPLVAGIMIASIVVGPADLADRPLQDLPDRRHRC